MDHPSRPSFGVKAIKIMNTKDRTHLQVVVQSTGMGPNRDPQILASKSPYVGNSTTKLIYGSCIERTSFVLAH